MCLVAGLTAFAPAGATGASEAIGMPFPGGQAVRIIQGYNGGSHRGRSHYALDLVLPGGSTSGVEVISPIEGSVSWGYAPGAGNGCMAIAFRDGSYSITLCHVLFHRQHRRGELIARGQSLGTVGPAGAVGNNGTPHVHMELHRGGLSSKPVPFSPPDGLALEGVALPASGAYSEHSLRGLIVSTNRGGSGSQPPSTAQGAQAAQPVTAAAAPAQQTSAAAPSPAARTGQPSLAAQAARSSSPVRAAVVHGTGSCLNVREKPSPDSAIVDCLPDGTEVPLGTSLERGGEHRWQQIQAKGWAASEYLQRTRAVVSGTAACLNVRENPSTAALVLGCLAEGTSVAVAAGPSRGADFDWYRIGSSSSVEKGGWVVAQYLD